MRRPSNSTFMGHPAGLFVLLFTELCERFSYYGTRGLLKLYMVNYLFISVRQTLEGKAYDGRGNPDDVIGWGFVRSLLPTIEPEALEQCASERVTGLLTRTVGMTADLAQSVARQQCSVESTASYLYGLYTLLVYLTPVFGGLLADRYLGQKKSVYAGVITLALGHLVLFGAENLFFIGLLLLVIGTGLFKPTIATQVGSLYAPEDARRDGAFTLFYMGIIFGAFICGFVCNKLAAQYGWRYGFLAAGIVMCIGLLVQFLGRRYLAPDTLQERKASGSLTAEKQPLTANERKRVWALLALFLLNAVIWAVYPQRDRMTPPWVDQEHLWPWWASSTWSQSVNPFFIFVLAPFLDRFWAAQNKRGTEPFSAAKMALGCVLACVAVLVMALGARIMGDDTGSLFWAISCTVLVTIGQLYLTPVAMSLVTRVAPVRIASLMMGVWFLSSIVGNMLSGPISRFYMLLPAEIVLVLILVSGIALGVAIWLFNKPLQRLIMQPDPAGGLTSASPPGGAHPGRSR